MGVVPAASAGGRERISACLGVARWKRGFVAEFLAETGRRPAFRRTVAGAVAVAAADGGAVGVWASREPPDLAPAAAAAGVPLVRIEDGFLRSVGLGCDLVPPLSLVFDRSGIYCDPQRPGDLGLLLRETDFTPALLARARRLIDRIVAARVSKYNLPAAADRIRWPPGRRRILVPGQVEDDLSVRRGGAGVRGNAELLERVRAANPGAFILYRPHPDVVAGHRRGRLGAAEALRQADAIAHEGRLPDLLGEIDELHTLTSLSGFEALLRGVSVTVYGCPFYAGWGLTHDFAAPPRGRILSLEALTAASLILYPRYRDPLTGRPCGPETAVDRLTQTDLWRPRPTVLLRRVQGRLSRRWSGGGRVSQAAAAGD